MKKTISKLLSAAVVIMAALEHHRVTKKFHVNGTISDTKDSILYFENMSLNGPEVVDSVKLGETASSLLTAIMKSHYAPNFIVFA